MKKILLGNLILSTLITANNQISINSGVKEYTNSKTKIDGVTLNVNLSHQYENGKISIGYLKDEVDRENKIANTPLESLEVEKYNGIYTHHIFNDLDGKISYLKIFDNLAPTDQGKIYGIGMVYKFTKGFETKLDYYQSDYIQFDVNQYEITLTKSFKQDELKGKIIFEGKKINIDGNKYANYSFKEKDYFTKSVKLNLSYKEYFGAIGANFGERIFTVLDDGSKVQHHAIEQDKGYMINVGKKFDNFDLYAKYSYENGKELPENQTDVDTKVVLVGLNYRF